ncbi:MAG: TonB-dependent receptor, partial [Bacteroidota bacterium]
VQAAQDAFANGNGSGTGYNGSNWALAETNVGQLGLYLQDEISVSPDFTLTVGVRFDRPLYFDTQDKIQENIDRNCCYNPDIVYYDEFDNPTQFDHTTLPTNDFLVSPRLGFNYDVNGNQTVQLRGGAGLFSGRFPFVWIGNQVANPNFFFYNTTAPDFQFPQVFRGNLGGDFAIGNGWLLTTDFIYTADRNAMMVRNYGLRTPRGTLGGEAGGPDTRPIYLAEDRATVFGGATNAYVFTNTSVGNSINASFELKRNWTNGLYTSIGYNYLNAKEASSIEAEISSDAYERNPAFGNVNQPVLSPSLYGNRHRIVGSAHRRFEYGAGEKWATTIALFFQYAEGGRFSYTYNGDINNDGSGLNDLIYIPTSSEMGQLNFTGGDAQRSAFNNFIEQDEYLNSRRGQYAERYAVLSPWYSNWDIRLAQDLRFGNSNSVQFTIDILNVGNLISSSWGVRQFPSTTQPIGVSVGEDGVPVYSFDETLTNTFTNDFSLLSRWQMQFGLRYRF